MPCKPEKTFSSHTKVWYRDYFNGVKLLAQFYIIFNKNTNLSFICVTKKYIHHIFLHPLLLHIIDIKDVCDLYIRNDFNSWKFEEFSPRILRQIANISPYMEL